MALPTLTRHEHVFVMLLDDGDNRFNRSSLDAINACLDEIDAAEGPKALVTAGTGKFFSNGLDLDWLSAGDEDMVEFIDEVMLMWGRVVEAGYPTVAAVNGHAFAGGAMFAMAFDQRVMRADRGFWCVNELLLGMNLPAGMAAILQTKLAPGVVHRAVTQAHRFDGPEAVSCGIADGAVEESAVLSDAIARAASLAHTASPTLTALKRRLHGPAIDLLTGTSTDS